MSIDQALKILNDNESGKVYTRAEAERMLNFSTKLAQIVVKSPIRSTKKTKLRVA